jgi:tetratricopeptide (TPR) repeat protein
MTFAARDPKNADWQFALSTSYIKMGDISAARGDHDGALKAYVDGLEIAKALAARNPKNANWQRDLSVSYGMVATIHEARHDFSRALGGYQKTLEIQQRLAARDPENADWQHDIAITYTKLGDVARKRGDKRDARKSYEHAIAILQSIAAKDAFNTDWQRDLMENFLKLALVDDAKAKYYVGEGSGILVSLRAKEKLSFQPLFVADLLSVLRDLNREGKLTADQKEWIAMFEDAMQEPENAGPHR